MINKLFFSICLKTCSSDPRNSSDYVLIADANNLGEQNASAAVLATNDHIHGTATHAL